MLFIVMVSRRLTYPAHYLKHLCLSCPPCIVQHPHIKFVQSDQDNHTFRRKQNKRAEILGIRSTATVRYLIGKLEALQVRHLALLGPTAVASTEFLRFERWNYILGTFASPLASSSSISFILCRVRFCRLGHTQHKTGKASVLSSERNRRRALLGHSAHRTDTSPDETGAQRVVYYGL